MRVLLSASGGFNYFGLIAGLSIATVAVLAFFARKHLKRHLYKDIVFDIVLFTLIPGFLGARLFYAIFFNVSNNGAFGFLDFFNFAVGGVSFYGAFIGGLVGLIVLTILRRKRYDKNGLLSTLDFSSPFLILAQGITIMFGFIGNISYGKFFEDGSVFPIGYFVENGINGSGYYQATFLYEGVWCLIGGAALALIYFSKSRQSYNGFVFSLYCVFYGVGKMLIELLRSDPLYMVAPANGSEGLRANVFFSILLITCGVIINIVYIARALAAKKKPFIFAMPENAASGLYFAPPVLKASLPDESQREEIAIKAKKELGISAKPKEQTKNIEQLQDGFDD